MTKRLLRSHLLNLLNVADERMAISNPALTKAAVWNIIMRECWEDNQEPVTDSTLQLFFVEFSNQLFLLKEMSLIKQAS